MNRFFIILVFNFLFLAHASMPRTDHKTGIKPNAVDESILLAQKQDFKNVCLRSDLQEAIDFKLVEMANYFKSLKCGLSDHVCWWFLFHLAIGESSNDLMTKFAQKVPLRFSKELGYGSFAGEAHIAQYPAYWLLKGVKLNTLLDSGQSIKDYLNNTPWEKVHIDTISRTNTYNVNEELSWYWMAQALYPQLPVLTQSTHFESACGGGHHLSGLYFAQSPEFDDELEEFMQKINTMVLSKNIPPAYQNYPYYELYKFYVLSHAFESLYLSKQQALIDDKLVDKAIKHIEAIYKHFLAVKVQVESPEQFLETIKADGTSHYYYGDTLGHFRFGLNLCSGKE